MNVPQISDMQRWQAIHKQMVTPPALLNTMLQNTLGSLLEYYGHTSPAPALAEVCYKAIARLIT